MSEMRDLFPNQPDRVVGLNMGGYEATQFGTGGLMQAHEYVQRGLLRPKTGRHADPWVGHYANTDLGTRRMMPVYLNTPMPRLIVSPPGGGKTAGPMTNTALTWPHGVLVLDPKGEVWSQTAGARASLMKRRPVLLCTEPCTDVFNPILWFRWDASEPDGGESGERDLRVLTRFLLEGTATGEHQLLQKIPETILPGLLVHVRMAQLAPRPESVLADLDPRVHERSMAELRRLLNLPPKTGKVLAVMMQQSKFRVVRDAGNALLSAMLADGKLARDIQLVADTTLRVWQDRAIRRMTYRPVHDGPAAEPAPNTAAFSELRKRTDFYLSVPPIDMADYSPVMRTVLGCAIDELTRSPAHWDAPDVHLLIDEFPVLRRMEIIASAIGFLRQYRVVPHFFVQAVGQLKTWYEKEFALFDEACTKIFFSSSGRESVEMVSDYLGQATVDNLGAAYSQGEHEDFTQQSGTVHTSGWGGGESWQDGWFFRHGFGGNSNWNESIAKQDMSGHIVGTNRNYTLNHSKVGRPVLTPDEVRRMAPHEMIVLPRHLRPMRLLNIPFYEFSDLRERSQHPPPRRLSFAEFMNRPSTEGRS